MAVTSPDVDEPPAGAVSARRRTVGTAGAIVAVALVTLAALIFTLADRVRRHSPTTVLDGLVTCTGGRPSVDVQAMAPPTYTVSVRADGSFRAVFTAAFRNSGTAPCGLEQTTTGARVQPPSLLVDGGSEPPDGSHARVDLPPDKRTHTVRVTSMGAGAAGKSGFGADVIRFAVFDDYPPLLSYTRYPDRPVDVPGTLVVVNVPAGSSVTAPADVDAPVRRVTERTAAFAPPTSAGDLVRFDVGYERPTAHRLAAVAPYVLTAGVAVLVTAWLATGRRKGG